jgi:peptidoglycan-N-acetylglucosamine deacetylase
MCLATARPEPVCYRVTYAVAKTGWHLSQMCFSSVNVRFVRGLFFMFVRLLMAYAFFLYAGSAGAHAAECQGNTDALGTSRIIAIDSSEHQRLGKEQYSETLPLQDHEVVLTFDDGPLPPNTTRVLDALAAECVKAHFFLVGEMAKNHPGLVKRIYQEGHTIGTHTEHHPHLNRVPLQRAEKEIDDGIASVSAALGDSKAVAPFFRFPYFDSTGAAENYVLGKKLVIWSADYWVYDWTPISSEKIAALMIEKLERTHKGMVLFHDIQQRTAAAVPLVLRELKSRGYHIVQVVPAGADHPKTVTDASQWVPVH